jgi:hypothetical protein
MLRKTLIATALIVLGSAGGASGHPQTTWAPIGRPPLTDREAAALVTPVPEVRPGNAPMNDYHVTAADLRYFRTVTNGITDQTSIQFNPWNKYVDGRSFLSHPSTDDLIQWAAFKWGIPVNLLRAQTVVESNWQMGLGGDLTAVPSSWLPFYPPAAQRFCGELCPRVLRLGANTDAHGSRPPVGEPVEDDPRARETRQGQR